MQGRELYRVTEVWRAHWYIFSSATIISIGQLAMDVPVIETERLILRGHRLDDFDALAAMWGDPVVARFIGGKSSTREESWARLLRYAGHWKLLGFGYWAVELKDGEQFVGDVGFANWQRDITPSLDGMPESGWVFTPGVHGRGVASEAAQAALGWMDMQFCGLTTTCIIGVENAASIRVAEKNGYREFTRAEFKGSQVVQFRR
jgi:RimJ/RimL family protein N-acetyltransferase